MKGTIIEKPQKEKLKLCVICDKDCTEDHSPKANKECGCIICETILAKNGEYMCTTDMWKILEERKEREERARV